MSPYRTKEDIIQLLNDFCSYHNTLIFLPESFIHAGMPHLLRETLYVSEAELGVSGVVIYKEDVGLSLRLAIDKSSYGTNGTYYGILIIADHFGGKGKADSAAISHLAGLIDRSRPDTLGFHII